MNATEMAGLIGRRGLMDWDKFKVEVIISDVARLDLQVGRVKAAGASGLLCSDVAEREF